MSEYQYYECRAIDQPLTKQQQEELRRLSSRAEITPTRFQNEYDYGDFRGSPEELMKRYFIGITQHQAVLRVNGAVTVLALPTVLSIAPSSSCG